MTTLCKMQLSDLKKKFREVNGSWEACEKDGRLANHELKANRGLPPPLAHPTYHLLPMFPPFTACFIVYFLSRIMSIMSAQPHP